MIRSKYVELVKAAAAGDVDGVVELSTNIMPTMPMAEVALEVVVSSETPDMMMVDALVGIGIPMSGTTYLALEKAPGAESSMAMKHHKVAAILLDPVAGIGKLERALVGYDPNYINGKALSIAASSGDVAAVKLLVEMGADPTISATALLRATEKGYLRVAMYLVEHGWDIQGGDGRIITEALKDVNAAIATYFQYKLGGVDLSSLAPESEYD